MQRNPSFTEAENLLPDPELVLEKQLKCHLKIFNGCSFEL